MHRSTSVRFESVLGVAVFCEVMCHVGIGSADGWTVAGSGTANSTEARSSSRLSQEDVDPSPPVKFIIATRCPITADTSHETSFALTQQARFQRQQVQRESEHHQQKYSLRSSGKSPWKPSESTEVPATPCPPQTSWRSRAGTSPR